MKYSRFMGIASVFLLVFVLFQQWKMEKQDSRLRDLEYLVNSQITQEQGKQREPSETMEAQMIKAAAAARNSTVLVNVYEPTTVHHYADTFEEVEGTEVVTDALSGQGSGVIVGKDLVLTCYHIAAGRSRLGVELSGQPEKEARILKADQRNDLALLEVPDLNGEPANLGGGLQLGQPVLCAGNPASHRLSGTVTIGIVSALHREMGSLNEEGETVTVFQTDAAINGGSSGGGIFDLRGNLQGIVSRKYLGAHGSDTQLEGIGMCIPIAYAAALLEPSGT